MQTIAISKQPESQSTHEKKAKENDQDRKKEDPTYQKINKRRIQEEKREGRNIENL